MNLHSTMFILLAQAIIDAVEKYLHSTMFILLHNYNAFHYIDNFKFTFHYVYIITLQKTTYFVCSLRFTFHYVYIITD